MHCLFNVSIVINKILSFAVRKNSIDNKSDSISKMIEVDIFLNNELDNNIRNKNHKNINVMCSPSPEAAILIKGHVSTTTIGRHRDFLQVQRSVAISKKLYA